MRRATAHVRSPLSAFPVIVPVALPETLQNHPELPARPTSPHRAISPASSRASTFDVAAAVRTFKLFEQAPEELIDLIMARMRSRLVEKGDEICREGEDA